MSYDARNLTKDELVVLEKLLEQYQLATAQTLKPTRVIWKITKLIVFVSLVFLPGAYFKSLTGSPNSDPLFIIAAVMGLLVVSVGVLSIGDYLKKREQVRLKLKAIRGDIDDRLVEIFDSELKSVAVISKVEAIWESNKADHNVPVAYYRLILDEGIIELRNGEFQFPEQGFRKRVVLTRARQSRVVFSFTTTGDPVEIDDGDNSMPKEQRVV